MEDGRVGSTSGVIGFRSHTQGPRDLATEVQPARACLRCGYLELYVDVRQLQARLGRGA